MFRITSDVIEDSLSRAEMTGNHAGAVATFEGRVRDHNEGKTVLSLEYEAYAPMAEKEGQRILEEARSRFDILEARCIHRTGLLALGEMAVWVGVTAAHRKEAFAACRFIIDEVKHRLPIWKKETYTDGISGWINCSHGAQEPHPSAITEEAYYTRQTRLKEVGLAGQAKLKSSRVLVVGAGGLGSPALQYLAAAGVGTLGICEFDTLSVDNLHRQVLYRAAEVGQSKAMLAANHLSQLNPLITINVHPEPITAGTAGQLFQEYDLVLDCTDNFEARFLLNDTAVLTATPLIQASIYQYEGQLQTYLPAQGSPCLRCLWPTPPDASCIGTCEETGVLGAVPGVLGSMQAMEALKILLDLPGILAQDLLLVDLLSHETRRLRRQKNPSCPICSEKASIYERQPAGVRTATTLREVSLAAITLTDFILIDIRESHELQNDPLHWPGVLNIPASQWTTQSYRLKPESSYLLVCQRGIRSASLANSLYAQGDTRFYALSEGIYALNTFSARKSASGLKSE